MKYCVLAALAVILVMIGLTLGEECNEVCPLLYDPVCGSNDETEPMNFANMCAFDAYNCKNPDNRLEIMKKGRCDDDQETS